MPSYIWFWIGSSYKMFWTHVLLLVISSFRIKVNKRCGIIRNGCNDNTFPKASRTGCWKCGICLFVGFKTCFFEWTVFWAPGNSLVCVIVPLQERTGVQMIMIQDDPMPTGADKPLRITGDPHKVQVGLRRAHCVTSFHFTLNFTHFMTSVFH